MRKKFTYSEMSKTQSALVEIPKTMKRLLALANELVGEEGTSYHDELLVSLSQDKELASKFDLLQESMENVHEKSKMIQAHVLEVNQALELGFETVIELQNHPAVKKNRQRDNSPGRKNTQR